MSRREREQSTNLSTKSVTEEGTTKHEMEHKKCHGGSDNKARSGAQESVTEGATTKHEGEHKKCHGGRENKARTGKFATLTNGSMGLSKGVLKGVSANLQQDHYGNVAGTASITSA